MTEIAPNWTVPDPSTLSRRPWIWLAVPVLVACAAVLWINLADLTGAWLWTGRVIGGLAVTVLVLALAGALYQWRGRRRDLVRHPPPGGMVEVGVHRFHLHVMGEGSPAVVFDSMMGESALGWREIQERVSATVRTVSYDRAGFGWSDWAGTPRTTGQIADELHAALSAAGIEPPYVLVGHVFGALNARAFTHRYPDEVAGLVLVDPLHEDKPLRMPEQHEEFDRQAISQARLVGALAPFGLFRLLVRSGLLQQVEQRLERFPEGARDQARSVLLRTDYWEALYREFTEWKIGVDELRSSGSLEDLPLTVITPGVWDPDDFPPGFPVEETREVWRELHRDLASRSSRGRHVIARESDDMVQWSQPDLLVEEIESIVGASRAGVRGV